MRDAQDEVTQRLRVLELLHALVVVQPLGLHLRHRAALQLVELAAQDQLGVLDDRLDQRQEVEGVRLRLGVEQRDRLQQIERERLVHREVVLQVDVHAQARALLRARNDLDDAAAEQRAEELPGAPAATGVTLDAMPIDTSTVAAIGFAQANISRWVEEEVMTNANTLVSLAMLKVNADVGNQDYIDYLVPFATYVLTRAEPSPITAIAVQESLRSEFGLTIPQHPTELVLRRLVQRGVLQPRNHVYALANRAFPVADVHARRQAARQQQEELGTAIRTFAQTQFGVSWTSQETEDTLIAYLRRFSIECLRTHKRGVALPAVDGEIEKALYILNAFIKSTHEAGTDDFLRLVELVKGHMLANAVLCDDLSAIPRHFGSVRFYLDTPVILRALKLEGDAKYRAVIELFELVTKLKGQLAIFEHTREEVHGVITATEKHFGDPRARGPIIEEMKRSGTTRSDLTLLAARLEEKLRGLGVVTHRTPRHDRAFQIDEAVLEESIRDEVLYYNQRAIEYDINSVRSIFTLRSGTTPRKLEDAGVVFVTSNGALARAAFEYGKKYECAREVASVITDFSLANIAWLKAPLAAPELPRLEVIAACHAALQPAEHLWTRYLDEIDRLEAQGGISARDHEVLRYSLRAREELMHLTIGAAEEFSARTVTEILDRVKADLVAEQNALLAQKEKEHAAAEDEWRKREAEHNEHRARLEAEVAAVRSSAEEERAIVKTGLDRIASVLAKCTGRGLAAVGAVAVVWHAASEWLGHSVAGTVPALVALGAGLAVLGGVLFAVHGFFGVSVRELVAKAEGHLQVRVGRLLRRLVLRKSHAPDNGRQTGPSGL
jgi:hypothetical protein